MMLIKCSLFALLSVALTSCGGSGGSSSSNTVIKNTSITQTPYVAHLENAKHLHMNLSLGDTPKDVYLLLSNGSTSQSKIAIGSRQNRQTERVVEKRGDSILHAPHEVALFRKKIPQLLRETVKNSNHTPKKKSLGISNAFYTDANAAVQASASVKYSHLVKTEFGNKTLKIWVSNESFGSGCPKARCVTQKMVDILGQSFLKSGRDNDIYDWVTNVYGEEWGVHNDAALIGERNDITIFLTDIDKDNSTNGGVIGYFYAKDNFLSSKVAGSNERLMFYIDSVLFANGTGSWDIDDFWPKETLSTLAHEFQHMIHFYQKTVLRTQIETDTWIDEMLAESTEDLIASKIHHSGPRGVDYRRGDAGEPNNQKGRYPRFNANNTRSLTSWSNTLADYAKVSAFGTFLLRNYGGAKVLHDIMYNNYADKEAIRYATHKDLKTLLREWGTAVLLSDDDNLVDLPSYNKGDYIPNAYHHSVYQLGAINFFNYAPTPRLSTSNVVEAEGNLYTRLTSHTTGAFSFDVTLADQVEATLIVKESK